MWIANKNNQLINLNDVSTIYIGRGKSYYDDDAVQQIYHYICIDNKKVAKCTNREYALNELEHIKECIIQGKPIYEVDGIKMNEDETGNLID